MVVLAIAEVGKGDVGELVLDRRRSDSAGWSRALRRPSPPGSTCPSRPSGSRPSRCGTTMLPDVSSNATVFQSGLLVSPSSPSKSEARSSRSGTSCSPCLHQPHQHRHVGVLPGVILEILGLPVDVELAQDDVAHGHGERRVGALLHRDPQVGELGGLRIVGADDDALGALVADLGVEMGVGRARLRHVRAPDDQEARSCTSRPIPARRSARPRSAARPAAGRSTSRRTTCTRRRAATDSASRRRSSPSTWPGSARSR